LTTAPGEVFHHEVTKRGIEASRERGGGQSPGIPMPGLMRSCSPVRLHTPVRATPRGIGPRVVIVRLISRGERRSLWRVPAPRVCRARAPASDGGGRSRRGTWG